MAAPNRNLRIPDPLWSLAQAKAEAEFTTVTAVIKQALVEYVGPAALAEAQQDTNQRKGKKS